MKLNLHKDEKILLELSPQNASALYWLLSRAWHVLFAVIVLAVWGFTSASHDIKQTLQVVHLNNHSTIILLMIVVILILFFIAYFFFRTVAKAYRYYITNQRVVIQYGFLSLNYRVIPLSQINDVNMRASLFERLFGIVSVYLDTVGTFASAFSFGSRSRAFNNSTRFEGLTSEQADKAITAISEIISARQSN